jgi:hypothetical protein
LVYIGAGPLEIYTSREESFIACHDLAAEAEQRIRYYNDTHDAKIHDAQVLCVDTSGAKPVKEEWYVPTERWRDDRRQ